MTSDTRTPDDIERDIVNERTQMSGTINDLQKKFSVEAIVNDLGNMFRDQGGDFGRTISSTIGRNPAAVVMVGVGLAWLFLGQDRKKSAILSVRQPDRASDGYRNTLASADWGNGALPKERSNDGPFYDGSRYSFGDGEMPHDRPFNGQDAEGKGHDHSEDSNGVIGSIRSSAGNVTNALSDAADSVGHAATDLTARLLHGTEGFSNDAKTRLLAARRAAHDARLASEAAMSRGSKAASNFFEDQPLVVGALAVALGAAIGGALPHTKIEDDTLGESSDRLFAEAQAVFHEERDKAMAVLRTAAQDAKGEIRETGSDLAGLLPDGKTFGNVIVERVSDATARVIDDAKSEIELQGLGRRET